MLGGAHHRAQAEVLAQPVSLQPFCGETLAKAAKTYGTRKALGPDHFRTNELATAPAEATQALAGILLDCEKAGLWPIQLLHVIVALLGKPARGERGFGKTAMLYRLWFVMRKPAVKK